MVCFPSPPPHCLRPEVLGSGPTAPEQVCPRVQGGRCPWPVAVAVHILETFCFPAERLPVSQGLTFPPARPSLSQSRHTPVSCLPVSPGLTATSVLVLLALAALFSLPAAQTSDLNLTRGFYLSSCPPHSVLPRSLLGLSGWSLVLQ